MNYTIIENITQRYQQYLPTNLIITNSIPSEALLIRLLVGSVKIKNNISNVLIDQTINYSSLGKVTNSIISTRPIKDALSNPLRMVDLDLYLRKTNHSNDRYYKSLIEEFCCYFYRSSQQSYTTAFIHLYRIIEFISYSFPLVYSSFSRDYYGSYNKLKNYFDKSKSELLFFEAFQNKILDESLLRSEVEINFMNVNPLLLSKHFSIIKNYLGDNVKNETFESSITFEYKYLLKLVIDIRNRYFHFAVGGQRNIQSSDIIDSDEFFYLLNEEIVNWIAVIYFEILNNSISQVIR